MSKRKVAKKVAEKPEAKETRKERKERIEHMEKEYHDTFFLRGFVREIENRMQRFVSKEIDRAVAEIIEELDLRGRY